MRGSFHTRLAMPKHSHQRSRPDGLRLMDMLQVLERPGDPGYLSMPAQGVAEFVVFDTKTLEKGTFDAELFKGPEEITAIVQSHFDAPARRVSERLWIV